MTTNTDNTTYLKDRLRKKLESTISDLNNTDLSIKVSSLDLKTEWTDKKLLDIVNKYKFNSILTSKTDVEFALRLFWSAYLNGTLPPKTPLINIICLLALKTPNPNNKDRYDTFFPSFIDGTECEILNIKIDTEIRTLPDNMGIMTKPDHNLDIKSKNLEKIVGEGMENISSIQDESKNESFGLYSESVKDGFLKYITTSLSNFSRNKTYNIDDIDFLKITSSICLLCFRAMVKNSSVMINTFHRVKLPANLRNLSGCFGEPKFHPPCLDFIQYLIANMNRNNTSAHSTMTIIINEYTIRKTDIAAENKSIIALLMYTCLMSTAMNGLTVIKLVQDVKRLFGINPEELIRYYYLDSNGANWRKITNFIKETSQKDAKQVSAPWCRMIDDCYYSNLKITEMGSVGVWLGGVLEFDSSHIGIFNSEWGKKLAPLFSKARQHGQMYYQMNKEDIQEEIMTDEMEMYIRKPDQSRYKALETVSENAINIEGLDGNGL